MATQTPKKPNGTAIAHATPEIRPLGIARRDPFYGFDAMRNMLDSFLGEPFLPETLVDLPTVNLYEKNGLYTLECAVPGYTKDDISVEARGDQVTISGTYAETKHDERAHYHHRGHLHRSLNSAVRRPPGRTAA